jgi:hypothetical protein
MPEKKTLERARKDAREGKATTTQAGEFVREEMEHIREGKHGARSTKQAIAIGLSKARRAGVKKERHRRGRENRRRAIMLKGKRRQAGRYPLRDRERPRLPFNAKVSRRLHTLPFRARPRRAHEAVAPQIAVLRRKKRFGPRVPRG